MKVGPCVQEGVETSDNRRRQGGAFVCIEGRACLIGSNPVA